MAATAEVIQRLTGLFQSQPCWKIQPLSHQLGYSIVSVRRFLSQCGYYSSFSHNGRWYTLSSIPQFSRDGLWFHKDIGFSKAGTLTKTLVALINASPAGLSAEQLGRKLRCRCHSVLVGLCRRGAIERQRQGRAYVYLSANAKRAKLQRQALVTPPASLLPAEIAVFVLAEFIKHPSAHPQKLAQKVSSSSGVRLDADQIRALFEHHGLKKMLQPPPSAS